MTEHSSVESRCLFCERLRVQAIGAKYNLSFMWQPMPHCTHKTCTCCPLHLKFHNMQEETPPGCIVVFLLVALILCYIGYAVNVPYHPILESWESLKEGVNTLFRSYFPNILFKDFDDFVFGKRVVVNGELILLN